MAARHGAKLNKTESVQVRFDPILKMATELAANAERRTLSSFTEMAVDRAVKEIVVARDKEGNAVNAWEVALQCWTAEPSTRLYILAKRYPDLLTIKERKIIDLFWIIEAIVDKALDRPVVEGDGRELFKSSLRFKAWDDFCQYGDDQIDGDELIKRVNKLFESAVKDGTFSWNQSNGYLKELKEREMNEATTLNPS